VTIAIDTTNGAYSILIPLIAEVGFRANLLGITDTTTSTRSTIVAIAEAIATMRAIGIHPFVTGIGI
jgi:hypothetical protein